MSIGQNQNINRYYDEQIDGKSYGFTVTSADDINAIARLERNLVVRYEQHVPLASVAIHAPSLEATHPSPEKSGPKHRGESRPIRDILKAIGGKF